MFSFQECENVPQQGGRGYGDGGGLAEVKGTVVWGRGLGRIGQGGEVYILEEDKWKRLTDGVEGEATLGVCAGRLVQVGSWGNEQAWSKKVMGWRGGRWSLMHVRYFGSMLEVLCS